MDRISSWRRLAKASERTNGMGGLLTASRVLFVESLAFRSLFYVALAATALALLAPLISGTTQNAGGSSASSASQPQIATMTAPPAPSVVAIDGRETLASAIEVKRLFFFLDKHDYARVVPLAQALTKRNNPEGMFVLGELAQFGLGVSKNLVEARSLYTDAAKMGEPDAVLRLARMLEQGLGGPPDRKTAASLYLFAARNQAEGADADLQRLNLVSERGITVEQAYDNLILNQDAGNAAHLMQDLVRDGSSPALCLVGMLYLYGKTVPQDGAKAAEFFSLGAKRDYAWCEWGMAKLSYGGAVNLAKDWVLAHVWYQLAVYTDILGKNKATAEQELAALEHQMQTQDVANAKAIFQRAFAP
jgi:TPR repeat protein